MLFRIALVLLTINSACQLDHSQPDPADIRENNVGVGLMGSFKYQAASVCFKALLVKYPAWLDVKVNLGIATLNLQEEGSEERALVLFDEVLSQRPDDARALYCSGLLHVYKGDDSAAVNFFNRVKRLRPRDPHIPYYLGQCSARAGDHQSALESYQQATVRDPYLRSAYYGAFQANQRLGRREEARAVLKQFQKLKNNPQARQVEFKYTRMGTLAEVIVVDQKEARPPKLPKGPLLGKPQPLDLPQGWSWNQDQTVTLTVCDINGDGSLDLFAARAWRQGKQLANGIYLNHGGTLKATPEHVFAGVESVNAVLWGDVNNDGHTDVYFCRTGANQLWYNQAGKEWKQAGTAPTEATLNTRDGALIDADHDGDLDLFLANDDGPNELLNNNLDGSWRALAVEQKLAGNAASQTVVCADLDNDRDLDIFVINRGAPNQVYLNELLWHYRPAPGFEQLKAASLSGCVPGDADADGQVELYCRSETGTLTQWKPDERGQWQARKLGESPASSLAWVDLTGAGRFQLLAAAQTGFTLYDPDLENRQVDGPNSSQYVLFANDPSKGPSLIVRNATGLYYLPPGPGRYPFMGLTFSGSTAGDGATRSNLSGIGTRYAVRNGSSWTAAASWRQQTGPGQSLAPHAVGLGTADQIDFVAITWSDGVFQTELNLQGKQLHQIVETQRQLASCPILFAWDGETYRFVSDVLGVGGIGFNLGRGEYGDPRPWEHFQLPNGLLDAQKGSYQLKIAEPMEEATYLDQVKLVAYDLPEPVQMVLDERMGVAEPQPTGKPVFYEEERQPVRAINQQGEDVTQSILRADRKAAPVGELDPRFLGLLQQEHQLSLDFGEAIDASQAWLVIDGWLEYPYSQTCFAAWQAERSYQALSLDARLADGQWHTILQEFGYPAGMPRRMSVPLTTLPAGVSWLRLRTNQEIYLDRLALIYAKNLAQLKVKEIPLTDAQLSAEGFAQRSTGPQRQPAYDDTKRTPLWDTRHQLGYYTRFGAVTELLASRDDALSIMGPGEAISLQFGPTLAAPARGYRRYLVLELVGWCKDMDLYTKNGETLAPLPGSGQSQAARTQLHALFNTRYQTGF